MKPGEIFRRLAKRTATLGRHEDLAWELYRRGASVAVVSDTLGISTHEASAMLRRLECSTRADKSAL